MEDWETFSPKTGYKPGRPGDWPPRWHRDMLRRCGGLRVVPRAGAAADGFDETIAAPPCVSRELAARLQSARCARGYTQRALGAALSVRAGDIADFEAARRPPGAAMLARMERLLGARLM